MTRDNIRNSSHVLQKRILLSHVYWYNSISAHTRLSVGHLLNSVRLDRWLWVGFSYISDRCEANRHQSHSMLFSAKSNLQMHQKHQMHYMELIIKKVNSQDKEKIWHIFSITDAEEVLANPLVMTQVSGPIFVQCRRKREEKGSTTGRSEGYFLVFGKYFAYDQWQIKKIVKNIGKRS